VVVPTPFKVALLGLEDYARVKRGAISADTLNNRDVLPVAILHNRDSLDVAINKNMRAGTLAKHDTLLVHVVQVARDNAVFLHKVLEHVEER
jgi:hypothetical protein